MRRWEVLELIEPEESEEHLRGWLVEVPRDATAGHLRPLCEDAGRLK